MNKLKRFNMTISSVSNKILTEETLYSDFPKSEIPCNLDDWDKTFKKNHEQTLKKEISSLGFRSDEFTTTHNGKHILFLGCSYTWGTGLYIDEVWSKILYNEISKKEKTSGFFNLGIPGDSIYSSITNAFKYFKNFGNPDVIFFNVQEIGRFYVYNKFKNKIHKATMSDNEVLNILAYQHYYMLEQYCNKNNIKLISFTWDLDNKENILKKFNTFYSLSPDQVSDFVLKYSTENPLEENCLTARDRSHLGKAYHLYWSKSAYAHYTE